MAAEKAAEEDLLQARAVLSALDLEGARRVRRVRMRSREVDFDHEKRENTWLRYEIAPHTNWSGCCRADGFVLESCRARVCVLYGVCDTT